MKLKQSKLYASGVYIDRYEADKTWLGTAMVILTGVAVCAVILLVMSVIG